ncbi:MAG TPA: diaminopimelate epimerase [Nitrospirota bacterium]
MYRIPFVKMHASGNDFILIDNLLEQVSGDMTAFVQKLCRPHYSVGADGLILLEPSDKSDFRWHFFNADGSEVEMCGNGSRCAAKFANLKGIAGRNLSFETLAGIIRAEVKDDFVKVQLTKPTFYRADFQIQVDGQDRRASFINTGVPHMVFFVEDLEAVDVQNTGQATRYHELFRPAGTNANFARVTGPDTMEIRTYERGVEGETFACGTGATAAALCAGAKGMVKSPVSLTTRGGNILKVYFDWDGTEFNEVFLEGDAVLIYQGLIEEGALQ